jgi:hypothetical protein
VVPLFGFSPFESPKVVYQLFATQRVAPIVPVLPSNTVPGAKDPAPAAVNSRAAIDLLPLQVFLTSETETAALPVLAVVEVIAREHPAPAIAAVVIETGVVWIESHFRI